MKQFVKNTIGRVSRLAMRQIPLVGHDRDSFNLNEVSFLMAAMESVQFYEQHMTGAEQFPTDLDLLTFALSKAPADGLILEFGVASGRTIRHLGNLSSRQIHGFDSFEGLPEMWRAGFEKGAFAQALPEVPHNVILHKGWFSDTLPEFLAQSDERAALLHIDCDLYSSTACVFDVLRDRIKPGTIIVFDEYFNYPGWKKHEHKAFEEFIKKTGFSFRYVGLVPSHQQVCVVVL